MPKAKKAEVRELSLTSSFVAGGYSYHVDPASSDYSTGKIGGKPLLFYRFEDYDGSSNPRTNLTSDGVLNTGVIANLSSSLGAGNLSSFPLYTANAPFSFRSSTGGDGLSDPVSRQVRSLKFGSSSGVFDSVDAPYDTLLRVDNVSPISSVEASAEGADHVSIDLNSEIIDSIFSNRGLTISTWIKPDLLDLSGEYAAAPPSARITSHSRPIFSLKRNSASTRESLINFGLVSILKDSSTGEFLSSTGAHKSLFFSFKTQFTGDSSSKVSVFTSENVVKEGVWQHLAVVVPPDDGTGNISSASGFRFYVNGALIKINPELAKQETDVVSRSLDAGVNKSEVKAEIGGYNASPDSGIVLPIGGVQHSIGSFFIGNIDDVALWDRALSGDEIAAIYHSKNGAYPPGSGYLNSPPRVIISEQDNNAGSYPSNVSPGSVTSNPPSYSDQLTVETPKVNAELDLNFIDIPEHLSKLVFVGNLETTAAITANWQSMAIGEFELVPGKTGNPGNDSIAVQNCTYFIDGPNGGATRDDPSFDPLLSSSGRLTYIKIQAPCDGVINIKYSWSSVDQSGKELQHDWPFYDITSYEPTSNDIADAGVSAPDPITGASNGSFASSTPETGVITIECDAGKWISIGVYSVDSIGGAGSLILENDNALCGLGCAGGCADEVAFKFYRVAPVPKDIPSNLGNVTQDLVTWTPVEIGSSNGSSDSVEEFTDPCQWKITGFGPSSGQGILDEVVTYIKIKAPCDGVICFDWEWGCDPAGTADLDYGFWAIYSEEPIGNVLSGLGTPIILDQSLGNGSQLSASGTSCISYKKNQWIVIGVHSDSISGNGSLTLSQPSINPDYAVTDPMCGLQCQGCASSIIPVDITDVSVPFPVKDPKLLDEDASGGAYLEVNSAQNNLDVSIKNVVDRLVRVGNLDAVRDILGVTFRPSVSLKGVKIRKLKPGPEGNTAVYGKSLARNNEDKDTFGYKTLPYPRGVGLQSSSRNQIFYFSGGKLSTARFPFGAPIDENDPTSLRNSLFRKSLATPNAGSVSVVGSGLSGIIIGSSDQHPSGDFFPYDETNAIQSFGFSGGSPLYGTQGEIYDEFFTRGSVAGALDEPLRNKDKIVINLSPSSETTLHHNDGSASQNFPMAYFNFVTRRWDPIGFGNGVSASPSTLQDLLEDQYLGFSQGWGNIYADSSAANVSIIDPQLADQYTGEKYVFRETGWFSPIDTFGFPLHPKYHATGSQQLDCELIVDRPFLLEKIIYQFSASMPELVSRLDYIESEYRGSGGAFFILNQRKANPDPGQESSYTNVYVASSSPPPKEWATPQDGGVNGPTGDFWTLPYDNGGIPRTMQLSPSGPNVYVDTVRDLVTFARIGTVWPDYDEEIENLIEPGFPHPASFMDLAIEVPASGTFSGEYTVAAPVRSPSQNSAVSVVYIGASVSSPDNIRRIYSSKDSSTRNSIDVATGRAHNGEFFGPEISYRVRGFGINKQIFAPKKDNVESPYLIRPGDRLVFGWQAPTYYSLNTSDTERRLSLLPGKGKIILYGSYLRDNKPIHDIYKDQLSSDAIHETIPSGPWVLDRFESEPQMMYSSSMREEHVTGTMLTRNADGSLSVTDPNDLDIGGVRAVSARASDGDLGKRWSFFRNNRLFDVEEQYYDSMQPHPIKLLFEYNGTTAYAVTVGSLSNIDPIANLMPPGGAPDLTTAPSALTRDNFNLYSNRTFIGSFPFDEIYASIPRVKRIDEKLIGNTVVRTMNVQAAVGGVQVGSHRLEGLRLMDTTDKRLSGKDALVTDGSDADFQFGVVFPLTDKSFDTEPLRGSTDIAYFRDGSIAQDFRSSLFGSYNPYISRFFGCFGDGYYQLPTFRRRTNVFLTPTAARECEYRGTKHGLINPTPLFSSAVFSGTRFGQPRDMMEQRQYTRFSLTDSSLTDAAVEVVFIDRTVLPDINGSRTNNVVTGSATNSSNVSPFATSEHPYDDALADSGVIWDRSTPLPEEALAF